MILQPIPENIRKSFFAAESYIMISWKKKKNYQKEEIALVRIEQLYPLPLIQLREVIKRYNKATAWHWIQEEPANMGAGDFLLQNFREVPLKFTSRPPSGSPATGSSDLHKIQQQLLVDKAMGQCSCEVANMKPAGCIVRKRKTRHAKDNKNNLSKFFR